MGSSRFDAGLEKDEPSTDPASPDGYAGPAGGAVGGFPAGKRVSGGR